MKIKYIILLIIFIFIIGIIIYINISEQRIPVLCYHRFMNESEKNKYSKEDSFVVTDKEFERQMKLYKLLGYKTITIDELYLWKKGELKLPRRSVMITVDDGHISVYKYAYSILKKYNMKATMFTIGNRVKNKTVEYKEGKNEDVFIGKDLIKEMNPIVQTVSHSYGFHIMNLKEGKIKSMTLQEIKKDLDNSEKIFKEKVISYPFGAYTNDLLKELIKREYKLGFIYKNPWSKTVKKDNFLLIPRIKVTGKMGIIKFILINIIY